MRPRRFNLIDQLGCIPAGQAYAFDVAVVRSAAAAENVDMRKAAQHLSRNDHSRAPPDAPAASDSHEHEVGVKSRFVKCGSGPHPYVVTRASGALDVDDAVRTEPSECAGR